MLPECYHNVAYPTSTQFDKDGKVTRYGVRWHMVGNDEWLECLGCGERWHPQKPK